MEPTGRDSHRGRPQPTLHIVISVEQPPCAVIPNGSRLASLPQRRGAPGGNEAGTLPLPQNKSPKPAGGTGYSLPRTKTKSRAPGPRGRASCREQFQRPWRPPAQSARRIGNRQQGGAAWCTGASAPGSSEPPKRSGGERNTCGASEGSRLDGRVHGASHLASKLHNGTCHPFVVRWAVICGHGGRRLRGGSLARCRPARLRLAAGLLASEAAQEPRSGLLRWRTGSVQRHERLDRVFRLAVPEGDAHRGERRWVRVRGGKRHAIELEAHGWQAGKRGAIG